MKYLALILGVCFLFSTPTAIYAADDAATTAPTKRTQLRVCKFQRNLCEDVADIDFDNCQPSGSDCVGEYVEDTKQCAEDYSSCVGRIRLVLQFERRMLNADSVVKQ